MLSQEQRTRQTYRYDCIRGAFNGIIYVGLMTLALLIAIRYHEAPKWIKTFIASAESIGRLITPLTLFLGYRLKLPTARLTCIYMILTAAALIGASLAPGIAFYTTTVIITYILFAQPPQLMLHIYSQNYNKAERGSRVSTMFVLSTTAGIIISFFFGRWLNVDITSYHIQLLLMAFCALLAAAAVYRIPSTPLGKQASGSAWENFSLAWRDKLFGWLILGYVLLGIGNAMVIPIRIEYMANIAYDINASNFHITLITVVIPGASMIISTKIWGFIFDRVNFITVRLLINLCFIASFLTFFNSTDLVTLGISTMINGFAIAGGMIVWHLWVTKVAPKEKVPAYMSAHISFSGIKGLVAPAIGYLILHLLSPNAVALTASALIVLSSLMFACVWKEKRIK